MQEIIAAVPTPLNANGRPQMAAFLDHCRWLLVNGCDGLNILGSTGETNSISIADRIFVMDWAAENLDRAMLTVLVPRRIALLAGPRMSRVQTIPSKDERF